MNGAAMLRQLAMVVLFLQSPIALSDERIGQDSTEGALTDLLIRHSDLDLRVRLVVTCGDESWQDHHRDVHEQHVRSLFRQLDANQDGGLTSDEAVRMPSPVSMGQNGADDDVYVAFNFRVLDTDGSGSASLVELKQYLDSFGGTSLQIESRKSATRIDSLFHWLDANNDGQLRDVEWINWKELLERDWDGNGVLTHLELQPSSEVSLGDEFVAEPIRHEPSLSLFIKRTPPQGSADVILTVDIGKGQQWAPTIETVVADSLVKKGLSITSTNSGRVTLHLGKHQLNLRVLPPPLRQGQYFRAALLREYAAVRERTDGHVTANAELPPRLKWLIPLADGDGDGQLRSEELEECLNGLVVARQAVATSGLRLTILRSQQGLGSLIDQNLDGRLSHRELAGIPSALNGIADEKRAVTRQSIPTSASLILQQTGMTGAADSEPLHDAGPPWFYRADTNQDGDLSFAEFLGPMSTFQRLDLNVDGAIDIDEAIRADRSSTAKQGNE